MENTLKYFAKFIVETATPIAVGSGEKGLTVDRLIIRDANDLPYIPGTSLTGVVRHEIENSSQFEEKLVNKLFGYQGKNNDTDGQGSRISFSSAQLIADDGKTVLEGLLGEELDKEYYQYFQKLPERDHVRMTDKGSADTQGHGKYDEELVHRGTRFAFEIALTGTIADKEIWDKILHTIHQPFFRIGAGTRKGFGQLEIIDCRVKTFDLKLNTDFEAFLEKSSSLNYDCSLWTKFEYKKTKDKNWIHYQVNLMPENFFLFGAGFGDKDVDMKPKTERYFDWKSGSPKLEERLLIPATSVKGAISHRVAYHFNCLKENTLSKASAQSNIPKLYLKQVIDDFSFGIRAINSLTYSSTSKEWKEIEKQIENMSIEELYETSTIWKDYKEDCDVAKTQPRPNVGENNDAVKALFGYSKSKEDGARGKVIFSDVYHEKFTPKIFSHVAIDRFTGGGIDGALFQEKVVHTEQFTLDIHVEKNAFTDDYIKQAFEKTLEDLTTGRLQLGGNTTKGHGAFEGTYTII